MVLNSYINSCLKMILFRLHIPRELTTLRISIHVQVLVAKKSCTTLICTWSHGSFWLNIHPRSKVPSSLRWSQTGFWTWRKGCPPIRGVAGWWRQLCRLFQGRSKARSNAPLKDKRPNLLWFCEEGVTPLKMEAFQKKNSLPTVSFQGSEDLLMLSEWFFW